MKGTIRRTLAALMTSAAAAALAQPVSAQTAPPQTAEPAQQAGNVGIDDIIVTAQKRAQNLQNVPVAVSAIDSNALKAKGITDTSDLMGALPSLQITTPYGKTQPNFSLRGVSVANEFAASTASPVGVYVDEVYQSFRASHGQQLFDLDRVEVLRGPQGTLYGRNTTGGAISFFTKAPELGRNNGYVTLGYGNYNMITAEGAAEVTLVPDELGIRVAGTYAKGDGWLYNRAQKRDVGTTDSIAGRATLRWRPSAGLDIRLKVYGARDNPLAATPFGLGQLGGGRDVLGYSRFDPSQNGGTPLGENEINSDSSGHYFTDAYGGALTIKYDLSSKLSITSITGYDHGRYRNAPFDCDGSPNDVCSVRYFSSSTNFNQDLRFNLQDGPLNLTAGLYYGRDKVYTHNQPDFFGVLRPLLLGAGVPGTFSNPAVATPDSIGIVPAFAVNPSLTPSSPGFCAPVRVKADGFLDARTLIAFLTDVSINNSGGGGAGGAYSAGCRAAGAPTFSPILGEQYYTIDRPSKAIYADASYEVTAKLTVTAGLRYTWDKVKYEDGRTILYDLSGKNIAASTIPYSFPYNPNLPAINKQEHANRLTGRFNLSYNFTDHIMGYAQYSRGYRAGSYNGLAYQGLNQVYYIQPEKVNAYEAGLKTRFFDRRVQLNLAGFYYDYQNQQFTQVIGATTFTRSGNGRLFGGEAELTVQPTRRLRWDASLGLLDTEYTGNTIDPTNPSSATLPINGNPFPNASNVTLSSSLDWVAYERGNNKLRLHGDTTYVGKYYFDPFKNYGQTPCNKPAPGFNILQAGPAIACGNPGYWLFNGRISYETPKWALAIWGKNLTNKYYYNYGLNINIFGVDYLNRGMPRTYGVELTARF